MTSARRRLLILAAVALAHLWSAHCFRQVHTKPNATLQQKGQFFPDIAPPGARSETPIIFVPGITSGVLRARRKPGTKLGNEWCKDLPENDWFTLYVSALRATNVPCFLWAMTLQVREDGCVEDAEGLEISEVGFGKTDGSAILNPSDLVHFELYEKMIGKLERDHGYKRDVTLRFATYDWRKYGDKCWEDTWFPRLQGLIENSAQDAQGKPIILACHSMGCPLLHVFLARFVTPEWKQKHIKELIATGPAFAGATQIIQNFIQGPSYAMMPLAVSQIGRDAMLSMPAFYTLLPRLGMGAWTKNFTIVETPWKNYTMASLYDGSIFEDVEETVEDEHVQADLHAVHSVPNKTATKQELVQTKIENDVMVMTQQGCLCHSNCSTTLDPFLRIFSKLPNPMRFKFEEPWCYTKGSCGHAPLARGPGSKHWDYCGDWHNAVDAGPGFMFYPGVNTPRSSLMTTYFGKPVDYLQLKGLGAEQLKDRCLNDFECSAFDLDGWLKRGIIEPNKQWKSVSTAKDGVLQGLFVLRNSIYECRRSCPDLDVTYQVCGITTSAQRYQTYPSACHLRNAKCWIEDLEFVHSGPCNATYRTPQGCLCTGKCDVAVHSLPSHILAIDVPFNHKKWCLTADSCGYPIGPLHWDYCGDSDALQTGTGFDFFPQVIPPGSILKLHDSRNPVSLESLRHICGADPECGGFTTEGDLLTHAFAALPESWTVHSSTKSGVYRKQREVTTCQRSCEHEKKKPVCLIASQETFRNECMLNNYLCVPHPNHDLSHHERRVGACRRQVRTPLHKFPTEYLERVKDLGPPGVPVTCMYVTDVQTEMSWSYDPDFLQKGKVIAYSEGDGTVNIQSAEGPCQKWAELKDHPRVQLMPLKLGGSSHVTMLFNDDFLGKFNKVATKK